MNETSEAYSGELITVAQFRDLHEAHLARGLLESEGLRVFLADENLVNVNWLYSNLAGGVRLQVPEEEEGRARELLGETLYAREEDEPLPTCPNCDAEETEPYEPRRSRLAALGFLVFLFQIPFPPARWRCPQCGATWR